MVKSSLPFEVVGDESRQESSKRIQAGLKRVEVFLGSERANDVLSSDQRLKDLKLLCTIQRVLEKRRAQ